MNLPNWVTLTRILLIPAFVALLLVRWEQHALAVFVIAVSTDWLDGWLARRRNQVTTLGQLLDPLADKLLICSAFISLVDMRPELVKAWMVVIIVSREFAVTGLRNIAAVKGITIPASRLAKLKMIGQTVAVILILGEQQLGPAARYLVPVALWGAVALAFVSMGQYFVRFARDYGFD